MTTVYVVMERSEAEDVVVCVVSSPAKAHSYLDAIEDTERRRDMWFVTCVVDDTEAKVEA